MRLKDKAAPLVTTKEIMPIKSNVTRLFNIICLFSKNSFLTDFAQSQASKAILKLNKEIQIVNIKEKLISTPITIRKTAIQGTLICNDIMTHDL